MAGSMQPFDHCPFRALQRLLEMGVALTECEGPGGISPRAFTFAMRPFRDVARSLPLRWPVVRPRFLLLATPPEWQNSACPPGWSFNHYRNATTRSGVIGARRVDRLPFSRFFSRIVTPTPTKSTSATRIAISSDRLAPVWAAMQKSG